ncbi:IS3 family transposase [Shewanella subflava]|uniref:IS3 family transposase n=1 Tax=Shewanella subflava TaxID=2986476 RepID=A0ABT3I8H4_9GAMM|nr:IS3 family transposase [Shewanella subflava]MCW3172368.1 IS3 family transposase [Shewanella subflava]
MLQWVNNIAEFSDNTYGQRRVQKALNLLDYPVGRRKTAQLMKEANVWVRYFKKISRRCMMKMAPVFWLF